MKLSNIYKEYKSSILGFAILGLSGFILWSTKDNIAIVGPLFIPVIYYAGRIILGNDEAINKIDGSASAKPEDKQNDTQV